MKNSIFKKIVSVLAVSAMLITSTATVFAANEYASQSSPCEPDKTNWVFKRNPGTGQGVSVTTLDDGTYKMERSMFRTSTSECGIYGLTAETGYYNGTEMWYKASADGTKWEAVANPPNWGSADNYFCNYSFAGSKTFSKGTVQTKFDFAFEGDSNQCITIGFIGASATNENHYVGARIFRDSIRFWFPKNDGTSDPIYYNEDKTKLPCDKTWYTGTLKYDMDSKVITLSLKSKDNDSFSVVRSFDISNTTNYWGSETAGAISGVTFASYRGIDQSVVSTTPSPATSIWYFDNVSLDAYTETNYELANSYTSGDGIKSNAPATGFTVDGITLSRLTNVLDPANASLITASYDGEGRMIEAQSKPLSQIGEDAEDIEVSGDTIKSFILDMKTANPYINVFTGGTTATTVREVDFEDDFVLNQFTGTSSAYAFYGANGLDKLHGNNNNATGHKMSLVTEADGNTALKSERTRFRGSNLDWWYDSATGEFKSSSSQTATHGGYYIKLGDTKSSVKGSFRFKFAGSDVATQDIQITVGSESGVTAVERLARIRRNTSGTGQMRNANTNPANWANMVANEWYTMDFEITSTAFKYTITGTGLNYTGTLALSNIAAFDYVGFVSHRGDDMYKADVPTEGTTQSSVWYIDDIKLEY